MTTWNPQANDLFLKALEVHLPDERRRFLDEACAGDAALRAEVEALLEASARAGSFLERPAEAQVPTIEQPIIERPGTVIGPYKLLEQIGEGGFGVVFMAEQQQPVRRKVALKVLKPGMDTRQVIARFEAERQALALMDHPNIAKVLDAGETASGRPYFVMELVKGVPITEFCDQQHLTPRERLELFVPICQAVQHAHQKGIIHRDLKPTNVLVTAQDGQPSVKVIDFGIAKATGGQLTDKTVFTGFAQMIGTPLYMSPEQAGLSVDIDTRSDIYSLGVLLYELLTGTTPFDSERFKRAAYDEIRRIIREEEPPKPSTRLSESKDSLPSISAQRHMEPSKLTRLVRGELDWIVMKCLEKDRNRRYETANAFAMDLQRYLADEAVQACPPSAAYRMRKFARRNKRTLMAASAIVVVLGLGLFATAWQAVRATAAEHAAKIDRSRALEAERLAKGEAERANREAAKAKTEATIKVAVLHFLIEDLLGQASPGVQPDRELTLRRAVDRAAARVEARFADQPLVEADVRSTLGRIYVSLGESGEAERHFRRCSELGRRELGEEDPRTLATAAMLAEAISAKGMQDPASRSRLLEESRRLFEQTLISQRRVLGETDAATIMTASALACTLDYQGKPDEAQRILEPLLPLAQQRLGKDHPLVIAIMNDLANALRKLGRRQKNEALQLEAVRIYQQALDLSRRVRGQDHPTTLLLEMNLAISFEYLGRDEEGIKHKIREVDGRRRIFGEEHGYTLEAVHQLWETVRRLSAGQGGGPVRAVELTQAITNAEPQSGAAWTALGMARYEAGQWKPALEATEKSVASRKDSSLHDWLLLSMVHSRLGNKDEARRWYDQAVRWIEKDENPSDKRWANYRAEAEKLLKAAQEEGATKPESK
jgi:serine/threonine protein kinase